jgi:Lrp/AsnC family transcriptional regulator, leucine-responsive regulatory protein
MNTKWKEKTAIIDLNERYISDMAFQSESVLDNTDWNILRELQQDARLSYHELGRRVGLSAPAAAERVRKLEDKGVIKGYTAQVDPARVGLPLLAFIQLRCDPGKCLLKTSSVEEYPEIVEIHKLSGEHCTLLKVAISSMKHLEAFNERLGSHGPLISSIVTSTPWVRPMVDWENPEVNMNPPANPGWTISKED